MPRFDINFTATGTKRLLDPSVKPFERLTRLYLENVHDKLPNLKLQVDSLDQVHELINVLRECKSKFYFQCLEPFELHREQYVEDYFVDADDIEISVYTRCPKCGWERWFEDLEPRTEVCLNCREEFTVCISKEQCPKCLQRAWCVTVSDQ